MLSPIGRSPACASATFLASADHGSRGYRDRMARYDSSSESFPRFLPGNRHPEDLPDLQEYRFVLHQNAVIEAQLKVTTPSPDLASPVTERAQRAIGYPYPVIIQFVDEIDWGRSRKKANFAVSDSPPPEPAMTDSQVG